MKNWLLIFFFINFINISGKAFPVSPATQISILTCSPGNELYSLFGHTAIRLQDSTQQVDIVFNYGTFDFRTSHFYLKYAQGLLPYQLTVTSYDDFIDSYIQDDRSVWSQTLRLDSLEKQYFITLLSENYKPQNRTYLYNFLYDNCSTRVRDIIQKSTGRQINWHLPNKHKSFWNLLDEYLDKMPWIKWGIHTILGQPGAREATPYQYMFLPDYLLQELESATLRNQPLASPVHILFQAPVISIHTPWYTSPLFIFSLCTLLVIFTIRSSHSSRILKLFSFILFLTTGLVGCLLIFLGFFTQHPITAPNFNLLWANPLNLAVLPFLFRRHLPVLLQNYLTLYAILLLIGLPLWFFLQPAVPYATLPLFLLLLYLCSRLKSLNK